ncbi:MAG: YihY/virulence factor BrkB family protein [Brachymonas sp.]|nr:YihY/virulence factor BrkB family protein [Brachymonas sp.]
MSVLRASRYIWRLLWASFSKWLDDSCLRHGAALSYYMVLSLAPLLVILVGVIGFFFGQGTAQAQLVEAARNLAGEKAGALIQSLLMATQRKSEGTVASLMALGFLLMGASGVLVELREALDHIWMVPHARHKKQTVWQSIREVVLTRMLTFAILFAIGFLMMASLLLSAVLTVFERWMQQYLPDVLQFLNVFHPLLSFLLLLLLLITLMLWLPSRRPPFRMVWPGALLAAVLFSAGKTVIGMYLGTTVTASVYGAAGSVVALMIWVYYSSLIVLFGAEFAWVLHMTPKGTLPGSPAYQRVYHAALVARQHQITRLAEEIEALEAAGQGAGGGLPPRPHAPTSQPSAPPSVPQQE